MPPSSYDPKIYRGEALRAVAMPLGGIGTGTIAIAGDGSLRQWQIHNQINHLACVPDSFFAVWAHDPHDAAEPVARVLQSAALYDHDGPSPPPPTSNDHVVPQTHRRLLQRLPGVAETEFTGTYPIAQLRYLDPALPVQVAMEAFSPFIPLDADDSGLPAIVFNLTVTNPTDHPLRVSVAATLQNAVGWDGVAPINETKCHCYGGNTNELVRSSDTTTVAMGTTGVPEDDAGYGTMALSVRSPEVTALPQWDDLYAFWADFSGGGRLDDNVNAAPSPPRRTWNGALAVPMTLQPGESRTVPFLIAWHLPNRYVNFSQWDFVDAAHDTGPFRLGNRYNTRFGSARDVVQYVHDNAARLTKQTRLARDTFNDTTLPAPLIDAVTSQMSIIRSPTCFWVEDGSFYGFEGGCGASTAHHTDPIGGCCPLNCTHVWNYEMALSRLFPALERDMRDTEWDIQQHPSGYLPHRVPLPTTLPRLWDREIGGPANPALDGLLGAILKTYREYRAGGDGAWLAHVWPAVRKALDYVWTAHDPDRTGVIEGEQPNTYDISIYGANTFIGTLYLAALHAAATMARLQGEDDLAVACDNIAERGRDALEERLWNGEYYVQEVDLDRHPEQNWATGCHADHLLGQWWAHMLDLGHILDPEHVRAAALAIDHHNFRASLRGIAQQGSQQERQFATDEDGGLLVCTWPRGGRPTVPTRYSDEVWTGLEYEVAALLLYESDVEPAQRIVAATRARFDGRKQNPWNDIECGDHYVRAMASWSLLEAAVGYRYNAATAEIGFAPVIDPEHVRAPFVARDGWGTFSQEARNGGQEAAITLASGTLTINSLCLRPLGAADSVTVRIAERSVPATLSPADSDVRLAFSKPVTLRAGQTLSVSLT